MGLHKRDLSLLLQLQKYLGGIDTIHINQNLNKVNYSIDSKKEKRFIKYYYSYRKIPLINSKSCRFYFFKEVVKLMKEVVNLMNNKAHLTI
jgi:hypothetical protein